MSFRRRPFLHRDISFILVKLVYFMFFFYYYYLVCLISVFIYLYIYIFLLIYFVLFYVPRCYGMFHVPDFPLRLLFFYYPEHAFCLSSLLHKRDTRHSQKLIDPIALFLFISRPERTGISYITLFLHYIFKQMSCILVMQCFRVVYREISHE